MNGTDEYGIYGYFENQIRGKFAAASGYRLGNRREVPERKSRSFGYSSVNEFKSNFKEDAEETDAEDKDAESYDLTPISTSEEVGG